REVLRGDVVHRTVVERDQVVRHPATPCLGDLLRPPLTPATNGSPRIRQLHRANVRRVDQKPLLVAASVRIPVPATGDSREPRGIAWSHCLASTSRRSWLLRCVHVVVAVNGHRLDAGVHPDLGMTSMLGCDLLVGVVGEALADDVGVADAGWVAVRYGLRAV